MCKRERGVGEGAHAQFSLRCFLVQTLTLVRPIVLTGEQDRGIGQGQDWTLIRKKKSIQYRIINYFFNQQFQKEKKNHLLTITRKWPTTEKTNKSITVSFLTVK